MNTLSCFWQQNSQSNKRGYRSVKFSFVLSEVQTGKFDRGKEFEYNDHQRAGRQDRTADKQKGAIPKFIDSF